MCLCRLNEPSNYWGSVQDVVTRFLKESGCYITEQQSFDDRLVDRFFIRTEFIPQDTDFDAEALPRWRCASTASTLSPWTR